LGTLKGVKTALWSGLQRGLKGRFIGLGIFKGGCKPFGVWGPLKAVLKACVVGI